MNAYAKAIAAAILGAAGTAAVAIQAAVTDGSITSAEWATIGIAFLTALASTAGVYATANKPAAHGPTTKTADELAERSPRPPDKPQA